ncbi:MAG: hypothetical protein N2255_07720 [Kiritimatiellae bacterium]|nr:hypothetical protein [Kiritimatiellia bacterium]
MTAVNEWLVREYFETLGFLTIQTCKYVVPGRKKTAAEEFDLLVFNPRAKHHCVPANMIWTTGDLEGVGAAVVAVHGWHTGRFYARTFELSPDILGFVRPESLRIASEFLGSCPMARILCVPRLPASGKLREQTVAMLRQKGVDGVISFRTMLIELIRRVDVKKNYEKSDILQIIRLLKNYDLVAEPQMDLFEKKLRRKRKGGKTSNRAGS